MTAPAAHPQVQLAEEVAACYDDPLRFVLTMYPWGEPGPLAQHTGPDTWQRAYLERLGQHVRDRKFNGQHPVAPVRMAVASGHGIGKSVLVAWLVNWIMSTRPQAKGTVTANTFAQLRDKTWASVRYWTGLSLTKDWFSVTSERMYHNQHKASWFCSMQSCREENSEAFAGQHAADSSSFYIFDEDSAVPDAIHDVAEGGLTDGEPFMFLFGNPTRSTGSFHRACFGAGKGRWDAVTVDSRQCRFTNKEQLQEWVTDYGEDSDFVRVRVRGLPPRASELQYIDQTRVWDAQRRDGLEEAGDEPLVAGVDLSDGGAAWNVVRFRRGLDARSVPPIRMPGEATRGDRSVLLARLAELLAETDPDRRITMMFVDSAFGAPYVERLKAMGYRNVQEIRFGGTSPDRHFANHRAYMWTRMKDWLLSGCIPEDDTDLEMQLTGPGYHLNNSDKLVIESKEKMAARGVASPDDGDALALTFAFPVVARVSRAPKSSPRPQTTQNVGWMA